VFTLILCVDSSIPDVHGVLKKLEAASVPAAFVIVHDSVPVAFHYFVSGCIFK
jgi:hypothetical protein